MSINVSKLLKIVFKLNFLSFNTDTKNTENSKEQFKHHNKWILAFSPHLVPVYLVQKNGGKNQKNDICVIYPGHKCEIYGGAKKLKKRPTVLGTPDKSKILN